MSIMRKVVAVMLLAAVPVIGFAQDAKKELNPWIDCGIGAMLFDETTWAAVISNIIWDLGTTAVISDASSQHTCNSKKAKTALFIGATYANLSEETAKGDGKHLRAMLSIMGCESGSHAGIVASVRSQFGLELGDARYAAKTSAAKAESYYDIVQRTISDGYAQQCRV